MAHDGGLLTVQQELTMAAQTGGIGRVGSPGCDSDPPLLLSVRQHGVPQWWRPPASSRRSCSLFLAARLVPRVELSCYCYCLSRVRFGSDRAHDWPDVPSSGQSQFCPAD
ncbi:hypothetical protein CRG98_023009 [Punica granatum]|uniref:Uncharacterized protein n=1 Tax=Punica granatum TaxID=22663 RepID=A0A2I0JM78_PUNGR|nr:hypothetical protein CRG98_023009 [Punica granatum]